jgi:hypothetical protein
MQPFPTTSPVVLSDAARTATATTTTNNDGGDSKDDNEDDDDDDDNDNDDNKKLPALPAMSSKKSTASSAAAAKSRNVVDDLSAHFQKAGVSLPKKAAFTTYSTKVTDPILVRTFLEGGKFFVKVDMKIAAALTCGNGIKATLTPDGMGISFQRGVYASFFGNRCLRKDLSNAYSADSNRVSAHCKVWDEFMKKESNRCQNGVVYGEVQLVKLPIQCTGLVEQTYKGYVPIPVTCSYTVTDPDDGMTITTDHIQFVMNTTFKVMALHQLEEEKKATREDTHSWDITRDEDSE